MITHAQLDHPNVLPLLGVFRDHIDGPPMMVLPLIENGSLEDYIGHTRLTDSMFTQVVSAIVIVSRWISVDETGAGAWCDTGLSISSFEACPCFTWRSSLGT